MLIQTIQLNPTWILMWTIEMPILQSTTLISILILEINKQICFLKFEKRMEIYY